MAEVLCVLHGPYDEALGACPYCLREAGGRPRPPLPLGDEPPTDPFGDTSPRVVHTPHPDAAQVAAPTYIGRGAALLSFDEAANATVVDHRSGGLMGWLVVKAGGHYGEIVLITPGKILGRDPNKAEMRIDDEKASPLHARFLVEGGHFMLWDLDSSNGTYVNGQRITAATLLKENDEIKIGEHVFVLKTLGNGGATV